MHIENNGGVCKLLGASSKPRKRLLLHVIVLIGKSRIPIVET